MMEMNLELSIADPQIIEISASAAGVEEEHVQWRVGYAPVADPIPNGRVVFGTIHAGNETGTAETTVACLMKYRAESEPGDRFPELLAGSLALETLWDMARAHFATVSAMTGASVRIPPKAPEAEFYALKRFDDSEPDEHAESEDQTPQE